MGKRETLEQITYTDSNLSSERAKKLTLDLITSLQEVYGDALFCQFLLGDRKLLEIDPTTNEKKLDEFYKHIKNSQTISFELILDKTKLINKEIVNIQGHRIFLYFFPSALERFLLSDLSKLEKLLWDSESVTLYKVILLVLGHEIWLNGSYIAVVGGEELKRWREAISTSPQKNDEQVRNMYEIRQKNLYWQVPWLKQLTPIHFNINEWNQFEFLDPIAKILLIHQINLIILYTASRTTGDQNRPITATYTGTNQSAEMKFLNPAEQIDDEIITNVSDLKDILEWVYNLEWSNDRLSFVQIVVARNLCAIDPIMHHKAFLGSARNILKELKWNWRSFIEGKLNNYLSQVQALEDYVADTIQKFADQITNMNKSLLDTTLAAVGALIGSFIAALLKTTFNSLIFTIGMSAFAVYVFIFPLWYNMSYQWEQYKVVCKNFDERKNRFQERLYINKVNEIVGQQITSSKKRFEKWFYISIGIYLIICVFTLIIAFTLPRIIQNTV